MSNTEAKGQQFGLFSTIAMISGIVIGSGIFFKATNVLKATDGSVMLGVLAFCIAGISIVFGSLTVSELAARSDGSGGVIGYADTFVGKRFASAVGWLLVLLYLPAAISIESFVCGMYCCQLFGVEASLTNGFLIGSICFLFFFAMNIVPRLGGVFQNVSAILKFLPLVGFIIVGIFWGDSSAIHYGDLSTACRSLSWLAAVSPIAFAFEGWMMATSISNEVKNPKKNIPLAFTIAPLIILLTYVLYFVGMCFYLGPQEILARGDGYVLVAATKFLGKYGGNVIMTFIIVSVMGALNGNIMSALRFVAPLAERRIFPGANVFSKSSGKLCASKAAFILVFILSSVFSFVTYLLKQTGMIDPGFDFTEFAISSCYLLYILLYAQAVRLKRTGEIKSAFRGYVCPIMAMFGALVMVSGGALTGWQAPVPFSCFMALVLLVICVAVFYGGKAAAKEGAIENGGK
ncbi:MAG: APC family permease [Oscillospiraceae bacterium]|nr:APC family permease [Oscillospiraceae bacterium]